MGLVSPRLLPAPTFVFLALARRGLATGDARQQILQLALVLFDRAYASLAAVDVLFGPGQKFLAFGTGAGEFLALLFEFALPHRHGGCFFGDPRFAQLERVELPAQVAQARGLCVGDVMLIAQQAREAGRVLLAQQQH